MSLIVMPNGLPTSKVRQPLAKEEVDLVLKFQAWCQRRNIALDLICEDCIEAGNGPASRIVGDNKPGSLALHMTCAHADRVYGDDLTRQ